jgi:hypothetical protein
MTNRLNRLLWLLLMLAPLAVPTEASAQERDNDTPWWDRTSDDGPRRARRVDEAALADEGGLLPTETWAERLNSEGAEFYYSLRILGAEAGRAAFTIGGPVETDYGPVLPLQGMAVSVGFFAAVYPFENTAITYVDLDDGLPVWTEKVIDERDAHRVYAVTFDQDEFQADVARDRDGRMSEYSRYAPSDLHDALSWIVDIRTRPLEEGDIYVYHVYDGWKLSRLTCRVVDHTRMFTEFGMLPVIEMQFTREVMTSMAPLPWADDSTTLPPVYMLTDGPTDVGRGWFSNDELRLPIGVSITAPIGSMEMRLDRYVIP